MRPRLNKMMLLGLLLAGLFPFVSHAAELRLEASSADVRVGEEFAVEVILQTDESVNAVAGQIRFPEGVLAVKKISDGNSPVNLWIEHPENSSPGTVTFSGITPGGFSGINNSMFSIIFEAKETGTAAISLSNIKALKNDGTGTNLPVLLHNAVIEIKAGDTSEKKYEMKDAVPPEQFNLVVSRDSSVADGQWFVAFAASDKDSGIFRYEMREYRFWPLSFLTPWHPAESPQVLSDQARKSRVLVRAVDGAGNERVAYILPTHPLLWYEYVFYWLICTMGVLGMMAFVLKYYHVK